MNPEEIESKKEALLSFIPDLFADFLYYDRKECDEVSPEDVKFLFDQGHITKEELTEEFENQIEKIFKKD